MSQTDINQIDILIGNYEAKIEELKELRADFEKNLSADDSPAPVVEETPEVPEAPAEEEPPSTEDSSEEPEPEAETPEVEEKPEPKAKAKKATKKE